MDAFLVCARARACVCQYLEIICGKGRAKGEESRVACQRRARSRTREGKEKHRDERGEVKGTPLQPATDRHHPCLVMRPFLRREERGTPSVHAYATLWCSKKKCHRGGRPLHIRVHTKGIIDACIPSPNRIKAMPPRPCTTILPGHAAHLRLMRCVMLRNARSVCIFVCSTSATVRTRAHTSKCQVRNRQQGQRRMPPP